MTVMIYGEALCRRLQVGMHTHNYLPQRLERIADRIEVLASRTAPAIPKQASRHKAKASRRKPMAIEEIQEIYINNIIPSGSGFALNAAGMQVYIPVTVTKFFNLQIGETVRAALIPNKNDKNQSTPYMAVRIIRDEPAQPAPLVNDEDIEARVRQRSSMAMCGRKARCLRCCSPAASAMR
jgi:hypothetical protein